LWTKPATGDLLGTTITNIASGNFTEVGTAWAGEDRGPRWAGFSNNVAIGTLVLSPQNFTNTEYPLFYFYGTGVSNGMYMNTLDLSQFTSAAEVTASIQVASNLKMYFRSVNLGFTPPGSPTPTPEQFMATNFVGSMSQVPDIVVNQSGTVDWKTSYQRIDGFGGGVVFLSPGSLDPVASTNADTLFNTNNANQLGLTLLRIRIDPTTNWANALLDASNAVVRGARVLATPWTPPTGMKDNNNIVEGSLLPSQYSNYANYLNGFAAHMATNGAPLAAISIQNEPDANVNYESCVWTPAQLQAFCHTNASAITNAPVLMPESESYNTSYSDPTLDDPIAAANVSLIGGHLYGVNTIVDYPNAHNKGKPTWMTEYLVNDQTIGTAVATAQQIHDCLTVGNMSAYIWWKCLGDANGLVNASGVPQKRGFVMAQFSRFVRPGYYRFGVTNIGGALSVSAYRDTNSMNFAIVAVNTNANVDVTQTFYLTNFNAASVTPWMTSATNSLANLSSIPVTNSSFTYLIPAQSVVTFVGLGSGGVSPNIVISSTAYISSGPSFVLSWNATAGATYSVRKTNVLNGSSINWPAIVTNYPAGGAAGGPLSYTDTPATFGPAFYRVSSP
jgi:glucuronoarabinoxylan endo-1,4-beta-xylanase